jgi:hypothetical protein
MAGRRGVAVPAVLMLSVSWLLIPEPALAWGPATHVALGEAVLGALYLVPPAIQAVLARFPLHFLYGSIAADISVAKKYVPEGRHCHNWAVSVSGRLATAILPIWRRTPSPTTCSFRANFS